MARRLLPDDVWQQIAPLLPRHPARPKGGRPSIRSRDVLTGILFMLKTGIAWEDLPHEMGCGCGMTCLRRLREWQQMGIWPEIRQVLETYLPEAKRFDWSRTEGRHPGEADADTAKMQTTAAGTFAPQEAEHVSLEPQQQPDLLPQFTSSMQ